MVRIAPRADNRAPSIRVNFSPTPRDGAYSRATMSDDSSECATAECGLRRAEWPEHPGDLETAACRQSSRYRAGIQATVRGGERCRVRYADRQGDEDQPCSQHGPARAHPVHQLHRAGVGLHQGRGRRRQQPRVLYHRRDR